MLKIVLMEDPCSRWEFLAGFQPDKECLLVPDIKTKLSAERFFLKKGLCLPGASVLRVNEFFKELFYCLPPQRELVSDSFFRELFSDFAQNHSDPLVGNLQNSRQFLFCFSRFLPVLLHPEGSELIEEWFEAKGKSAAGRWGRWYHLAAEFFQFMEKKNIIHESGLKGLLAHEISSLNSPPFGQKNIIADLGMSCDPCEQFLLKEISLKANVTVLAPQLAQKGFYGEAEDIYSLALSEAVSQQIYGFSPAEGAAPAPSHLKKLAGYSRHSQKEASYGRFSKKTRPLFFRETSLTQLEEAKTAVAQVREWLERGVPEKDIEILAPDMESYWFCLKPHLEREGARAEKSSFACFSDFPAARRWLAALRLHLSYFRFSDLEHYAFYNEPKTEFSLFRSLYFHVPERKLSQKLLGGERKIRDEGKRARGGEFIEWALSLWPKDGDRSLLDLALKALQSLPLEENLSWAAWLRVLEEAVFSLEKEIAGEIRGGLSCLSFNALQSARGSHIVIMGLDEDSMKAPLPPVLTWEDRESLLSDLGFHLPFPHPEERERALLWLLQSSRLKEAVFSFAKTDFSGQAQNPSLFFISLENLFSLSEKDPETKRLTVWDSQKMQKSVKGILAGFPKEKKLFVKSLETSFNAPPKPFFQKSEIKFSARRLQYYSECGFRYAAEYIFHAGQEDLIDRELSPMKSGSLAHICFGDFLSESRSLDFSLEKSSEEIEEFVERLKPEERFFTHENQWLVVKSFLTGLMGKFLEEEKKRRSLFPHLSPCGIEREITAFWNKKTGQLEREGDYPFAGRADRIDYDEGSQSYFLIDYKAGDSSSMTNIKSWQAADFQLILYAHALEKGLVEDLPPAAVQALAYYSYRDFVFKGYAEKGSALESVFGNRSPARQPREILKQTINSACLLVQKCLDSIESGEFFAKPENEKTCEKCFGRKWCRAAHLD